MSGCVVITGAAGGIGRALVRRFATAGYSVIGIDREVVPSELPCEHYVACDLRRTVNESAYAKATFEHIREALAERPLRALINNAAVQIIGSTEQLDRECWKETLDVNVLAPFLWVQALLPELEAAPGCVINISSVHARLTKPGFVAYASSKAALSAMTRAMAVDLGERVRVNAIELAAVRTEMLLAGFSGALERLEELEKVHPQQRIGDPEEVAALALMIAGSEVRFLHGSVVGMDGGVASRLFDPV